MKYDAIADRIAVLKDATEKSQHAIDSLKCILDFGDDEKLNAAIRSVERSQTKYVKALDDAAKYCGAKL